MSIHYIANDPLSVKDLPLRLIQPRPPRPVDRAGFNFYGAVEEKAYEVGTPGFLFWQCREAALAALWRPRVRNWRRRFAPSRARLLRAAHSHRLSAQEQVSEITRQMLKVGR